MKKIVCLLLAAAALAACHPRESGDLARLKKLAAKEYAPKPQKHTQGNITSYDMTNPDRQQAMYLALNSSAPDITPYLRENANRLDPEYLFWLLARLSKEKAPLQEVLYWSYLAPLRAEQDAVLCQDETARQAPAALTYDFLLPALLPYRDELNALPPHERQGMIHQLTEKVDIWDRHNPPQNSPLWICYQGIEAFLNKPQLIEESRQPAARKAARDAYWKRINTTRQTEPDKRPLPYAGSRP